jgi:TolB-like protein
MNRSVLILSALILGGLESSCTSFNFATANNTSKAGVIIENENFYLGTSAHVYIDGKKIGSLQAREIKGYGLTNGNHILYIKYFYNLRSGLNFLNTVLYGKGITGPIQFTVNNDRLYFKFSSGWNVVFHNRIPIEASVSVKPNDTRILNIAITNSFNTVSRNIPVNSKIAIVNISSDSNVDSSFILEELTLAFVNSRQFTVVDRQTLNVIRAEQNFQLSGEVSDEDIISIGKFTGADVVITGAVSGNGEMRRLRLRALDVQTAQILAMSAEKI